MGLGPSPWVATRWSDSPCRLDRMRRGTGSRALWDSTFQRVRPTSPSGTSGNSSVPQFAGLPLSAHQASFLDGWRQITFPHRNDTIPPWRVLSPGFRHWDALGRYETDNMRRMRGPPVRY